MKKIIRTLVVALTAAGLLASCGFKDKEGTYSYSCVYYGNLHDDDRAEALKGFLDTVNGGYFAAKHSYTGKSSETVDMACEDFKQCCDKIDEADVLYYLAPQEQVIVSLVSDDTGMQLMYCRWVNTDEPVNEE